MNNVAADLQIICVPERDCDACVGATAACPLAAWTVVALLPAVTTFCMGPATCRLDKESYTFH